MPRTFILPELPYAPDALEPLMSAQTLRTHHGKHHAKYVEVLNKLLADSGREAGALEDVVREAAGAGERKLYNNAGQAWNHGFFWNSMTDAYAPPGGRLAEAVERVGGLPALKERFVDEGAGHFASGWAWLVARDD